MSDIKKSALIVLIITLLSSFFTQYAYAANDVDHAELMQYEGYGKAMYDSIVEQTTFVTGQYTDNKEFVNDSIDQVKDYADFWYNEYNDFDVACNNGLMTCFGEMTERGGAYVLTVGDWIKNLFSDYDEEFHSDDVADYSTFVTPVGNGQFIVNKGYRMIVSSPTKGSWIFTESNGPLFFSIGSASSDINEGSFYLYVGGKIMTDTVKYSADQRDQILSLRDSIGTNFSVATQLVYAMGGVIKFELLSDGSEVKPQQPIDSPSRDIVNYINNNTQQVVIPQLEPILVCPDGTRIKMAISGSTFIAADGTTMIVNKDGTAEVNGAICNLNWGKPTVQYTPDGQVQITQPDGTVIDGDGTTAPPGKVPGFTDLEGCDGVMCGIAKLLDGLGSLVKAIAGMVKDLLDGILGLFVPEDLDFISSEFTRITDKLTEKIAITENLKEMITGIFDGGESNPLQDITLDLPILDKPLQFGDMSLINEGVPILKKVISAICILYTLLYVYRKITGRGGVMEK